MRADISRSPSELGTVLRVLIEDTEVAGEGNRIVSRIADTVVEKLTEEWLDRNGEALLNSLSHDAVGVALKSVVAKKVFEVLKSD